MVLLSEGVVTFFSAVAVFAWDVVKFSVAVVTPDHTVAVVLVATGRKERATGGALIPESPWFQAILPFWQQHLFVSILGFTFRTGLPAQIFKSNISHTITPFRTRFTHLAHDYYVESNSHLPEKQEKPRQIAPPRLLSIRYSCARSLKVPWGKLFLDGVGCKKEEP